MGEGRRRGEESRGESREVREGARGFGTACRSDLALYRLGYEGTAKTKPVAVPSCSGTARRGNQNGGRTWTSSFQLLCGTTETHRVDAP